MLYEKGVLESEIMELLWQQHEEKLQVELLNLCLQVRVVNFCAVFFDSEPHLPHTERAVCAVGHLQQPGQSLGSLVAAGQRVIR
jgi:hypothetical protein